MSKFKVGDIVIGNDGANYAYNITVEGWKGKVTNIDDNTFGDIEVIAIDGSGAHHWVKSNCFDLFEENNQLQDYDFKLGETHTCSVILKPNGISLACKATEKTMKEWLDFVKKDNQVLKDFIDERKEEKEMELLDVYKKNSEREFKERIEKEIKKRISENVTIKCFDELVRVFENSCKDLFENQTVDNIILEKTGYMNSYAYDYSTVKQKIRCDVQEEFETLKEKYNDKIEEVEAQIKMIKETSNDYTYIMTMLRTYDIIDGEGKVLNFFYEESNEKIKEECECKKPCKKGRPRKNK